MFKLLVKMALQRQESIGWPPKLNLYKNVFSSGRKVVNEGHEEAIGNMRSLIMES